MFYNVSKYLGRNPKQMHNILSCRYFVHSFALEFVRECCFFFLSFRQMMAGARWKKKCGKEETVPNHGDILSQEALSLEQNSLDSQGMLNAS